MMRTRKSLQDLLFAGVIAAVALYGTVAVSTAQQAPVVQTGSATGVSSSGATLTGTIVPNGSETLAFFQYGTSSALGSQTAEQSIGTGYSSIGVNIAVSGLQANTTYYFRIVARNAGSFGNLPGELRTLYTAGTSSGNAPGITTNAATDITTSGAILRAYVAAGDHPGTAWFEYGPRADVLVYTTQQVPIADLSYYRTTNTSPFVSAPLSGLIAGTSYAFRAVVRSDDGAVNYGQTLGFYTLGGNPNAQNTNTYYYNPGVVTYSSYQQSYQYQPTYQQPMTVVTIPTYTPPPVVSQNPPRVAQAAAAKSYYYRILPPVVNSAVANAANRNAPRGGTGAQTASLSETVGEGSMAGNILFGLIFAALIFMIVTYTWRIYRFASYGV